MLNPVMNEGAIAYCRKLLADTVLALQGLSWSVHCWAMTPEMNVSGLFQEKLKKAIQYE
jgi:hypothetical protein